MPAAWRQAHTLRDAVPCRRCVPCSCGLLLAAWLVAEVACGVEGCGSRWIAATAHRLLWRLVRVAVDPGAASADAGAVGW
jgi:hypothetical protein